MRYVQLGRSGLKVSDLCMGCMTFGSRFYNIAAVDQAGANQLVEMALKAGVNFFDTSDSYSRGESEEILSRALKHTGAQREATIIATKVMSPMSDEALAGTSDVNNRGLSRHHILASCEGSLRRLDTDYIDLYQVHGWDPRTPLDETLRALEDLVRQGKVRYLGVSNWSARHLAKALALAGERLWDKIVSLQAYYSLACRDLEHELLPLCREEGLAVLPWSPLSGGFLTGKYRRGQEKPEGARRTGFDFPPVDEVKGYDAIEALIEIAAAHKATPAGVALAWLLASPGVTSIIVGANRPGQLADNLAAGAIKLGADELHRLNTITAPQPLYPQWMTEFQNRGR